MSLTPKNYIELEYSNTESLQYVVQEEQLALKNGYNVVCVISADVIINEARGITYFEEDQTTVEIGNIEVEILDVWSDEVEVVLTEAETKELIENIINKIR